jgi:hypothetical protein
MLIKYQSPGTYHSKDIAMVEVFNKQVKYKVKFVGTHREIMSHGTFM